MKIKTQDLTDYALDWAVEQAVLASMQIPDYNQRHMDDGYNPSTDWAQGGPIIEREKIGVWWATHIVDSEGNEHGNHWYAEPGMTDDNADETYTCMNGPTPLIAAMRCYVASKLGDEVEIPEVLT